MKYQNIFLFTESFLKTKRNTVLTIVLFSVFMLTGFSFSTIRQNKTETIITNAFQKLSLNETQSVEMLVQNKLLHGDSVAYVAKKRGIVFSEKKESLFDFIEKTRFEASPEVFPEESFLRTKETKPKSQIKTEVEKVVKKPSFNNRWNISLSSEEIDLLSKILWVEARGESLQGQKAVVEVVFNRLSNPEKIFGNSLTEVLSSPKQFCSWNLRNDAFDYEEQTNIILSVLNGKTNELTFDYVFFATSPHKKDYMKIENHYFCKL